MICREWGSIDVWKPLVYLESDIVCGHLASVVGSVLPPTISNLISRLLVGSRVPLLESNNLIFKVTGTQHLLAISGFHVGLFVNSCRKFYTKILNKKLQAFFDIFLLLLYFSFVGFSYSLLRAVTMMLFSIAGHSFFRQIPLSQLILVTFLLLISTDTSIYNSISFQLSIVAVTGIYYYQAFIGRSDFTAVLVGVTGVANNFKIARYIAENLLLSLWLSAYLSPIILYHFQTISLISPIATVLVFWMIPILIGFSIIIFLASLFIAPIFLFPLYVIVGVFGALSLSILRYLSKPEFLLEVNEISFTFVISFYILITLIHGLKILVMRKIQSKYHDQTYHSEHLSTTYSYSDHP